MVGHNYSNSVNILNSHFSLPESIYLKIHKFVKVEQLPGEDIRDYLLRVEGLSWAVNFGAGLPQQRVREDFVCALL